MTASKFIRQDFERMWLSGASLAEIRDHFGYACTGSVSGVVSRLGLPKRNPVGMTAKRDKNIRADYRNGMTVSELCKAYGLSQSRIKKILQTDPRLPQDPAPQKTRVKAWSCAPAAVARYLKQKGARA